ncbi:MAG: hypothetical protein HY096_05670 [Nitrospinae bacterium]|nr:hypothetical protein [Nitrospinota bacterium]
MLASFLEYLDEYDERIKSPMIGTLDKFASFKDSYGILIEGALNYDLISLDPHWGTTMRYKTLSEFWKLYPEKNFFDHPRSWKVKKETGTRVRLEARGYFGSALYCKFGSVDIFLNAPFDKMSFEQAQLSNILMECLEDTISRNQALIEKHKFFQTYDQFQVLFSPFSLTYNNDTFKHLKHLVPSGRYWCGDYGLMKSSIYGIRIVFDDKSIAEAFMKVKDRSLEIELLLELLNQLNKIEPDPSIDSIRNSLELEKKGKPSFKMQIVKKEVAFPEFINPYKPEPSHFKRARKRIAELAKKCSLSEGYYELDDAKIKLNSLRNAVVKEINSEVEKFDFRRAIPYLLTRIDALSDKYERETFRIKGSLEHEVDYNREKDYANEHDKYITMHKNYRYLIEKFVQIEPQGTKSLDKESFQYLIALIDWLHVFYYSSDSLHYGIHPVGMRVHKGFLVEVVHDKNISTQEKEFAEEKAKLELGLIGNPDDRVSSPRPLDDFLNALDTAANQDLGFSFRHMANVLHVLTQWPAFMSNVEIKPFYSANTEEIEKACLQTINGICHEEIISIINFLTLRKEDVICILNQETPCNDLPTWEHNKRFSRYSIRPLIIINGKYCWGPYSTMKSGLIWSGNIADGTLPFDLQSPAIKRELRHEKKLIEDALVVKAYEIVKRFTIFVEKNCELHSRDPLSCHPANIGDYDILAFCPDKNVVLNIECKDISPVHCLKDAKRLRKMIFGKDGVDEGHFRQINKRREYLLSNLLSIATTLKWSLDAQRLPKIVTIYLTRLSYWWTRFPPKKVDAHFLRIDLLSKFIEDL